MRNQNLLQFLTSRNYIAYKKDGLRRFKKYLGNNSYIKVVQSDNTEVETFHVYLAVNHSANYSELKFEAKYTNLLEELVFTELHDIEKSFSKLVKKTFITKHTNVVVFKYNDRLKYGRVVNSNDDFTDVYCMTDNFVYKVANDCIYDYTFENIKRLGQGTVKE